MATLHKVQDGSSFAFDLASAGNGEASAAARPAPPGSQEQVRLQVNGEPLIASSPVKVMAQPETGRVYHDEHFHGHAKVVGQPTMSDPFASIAAQGDEGGVSGEFAGKGRTSRGVDMLQRVSGDNKSAYNRALTSKATGLNPTMSMGLGVGMPTPMPKWPANWQSAAFEAVAVKKSYILSPPEIFAECAHAGEEKAKYPSYKFLLLSILGGCYVSFGFTTCLHVGGLMTQAPWNHDKSQVNVGLFKALFGAFGFPFGFTTIIVCGADLYTSICAYTMAAYMEGKTTIYHMVRLLALSWIGNFIGCAIMVGLWYASEVFDGRDMYTIYAAEDKVHHPWGATLVKGILANWLVGIATWMANAAQDLTGKFVGVWLPISAFAALGLEHCIANQFLLPMAIAQGANINAKQFVWNNLIPATIGNWIGGAIMIGFAYAMIFGRTPVRISNWWIHEVEPRLPWCRGSSTSSK